LRSSSIPEDSEMHGTGYGQHAPNKPAAPNAGIASWLTIGYRWPGVGEPERSVI